MINVTGWGERLTERGCGGIFSDKSTTFLKKSQGQVVLIKSSLPWHLKPTFCQDSEKKRLPLPKASSGYDDRKVLEVLKQFSALGGPPNLALLPHKNCLLVPPKIVLKSNKLFSGEVWPSPKLTLNCVTRIFCEDKTVIRFF